MNRRERAEQDLLRQAAALETEVVFGQHQRLRLEALSPKVTPKKNVNVLQAPHPLELQLRNPV